ncbi:MAG: DUF1272 domain-containing protein [Reichenbachiella sp.]|uniref:DUF1272 domain-containing protein n=1 Tax=Reichenbachiella sp. TaxID=2184521 RepID=UPI003266871C
MLEIRPNCENCNKPLHANSTEAMICSYECTYCVSCVNEVLHNVCPNCGGGFEKRPIRPQSGLLKNPASSTPVLKPVDLASFEPLMETNKNIAPNKR